MDKVIMLNGTSDKVKNPLPCDILGCRTPTPIPKILGGHLISISTTLSTPRSDLQPQRSSIAGLEQSASRNKIETNISAHEKVSRLRSLYPPDSLNGAMHSSLPDGRPDAETSIVHASSVILDDQLILTGSSTDTHAAFGPASSFLINHGQQVAHAVEPTITLATSIIANDEWLVAQPQSESHTQASINDATLSALKSEQLAARSKIASQSAVTTVEALQSWASPPVVEALTLPASEKTEQLSLKSVEPVRLGECQLVTLGSFPNALSYKRTFTYPNR